MFKTFTLLLVASTILLASVHGKDGKPTGKPITINCEMKDKKSCHLKNLSAVSPQQTYVISSSKEIERIYLTNSTVVVWNSNLCPPSNNLKRIHFTRNTIAMMTRDVFKNCKNLVEINLSYSGIFEIQIGIFKDLKQLWNINLRGNSLTWFAPQHIKGLEKLKVLDLRSNNLFHINPKELILEAECLTRLYLNDNNFACSEMDEIIDDSSTVINSNLTESDARVRSYDVDLIDEWRCLSLANWVNEFISVRGMHKKEICVEMGINCKPFIFSNAADEKIPPKSRGKGKVAGTQQEGSTKKEEGKKDSKGGCDKVIASLIVPIAFQVILNFIY